MIVETEWHAAKLFRAYPRSAPMLSHYRFLGDRYKQRFALCYGTVVLSVCLVCLQRWCIAAKRLDGSRCHLVRR